MQIDREGECPDKEGERYEYNYIKIERLREREVERCIQRERGGGDMY